MTHTYMTEQEIREAEQRCDTLESEGVYPRYMVALKASYCDNPTAIAVAREVAEIFRPQVAVAKQNNLRALADLRELRRVVRELHKALAACKSAVLCGENFDGQLQTDVTAALALAQQVEGGK